MIKKIANYSKAFGWFKGVELYSRQKWSRRDYSIQLPNFRNPIYLRRQTSDFEVFRDIFVYEQYRFDWPFPCRTILDAGANTGFSAIYFAHLFPGSTILALEPEIGNYQMLRRNTARYPEIHPVNKALWHTSTRMRVADSNEQKWAFQFEECKDAADGVSSASIPDLMSEFGLERIDLLKVDIEGAEKELFSQKTDWIHQVNALAIEFHDRFKPGCSDSVYSVVKRHAFKESVNSENHFFIRDHPIQSSVSDAES